MRVTAVALVLIIGAAVVLAFANTLNSWVLGGLLGGLASILLSIPISLALFTLLARRHDTQQNAAEQDFVDEPHFADEVYDEPVVYDAAGFSLPDDDELPSDLRPRFLPPGRRSPVSGYLPLPQAEEDEYDSSVTRANREPRNYPLQPRNAARARTQSDREEPARLQHGPRRHPSTRSLAQHQSAALRRARQEAQQNRMNRAGSSSLSRRDQENRLLSSRDLYSSRPLHSRDFSSGSRRSLDDFETHAPQRRYPRTGWHEAEDFSTEQFSEQGRHFPRQGYSSSRLRSERGDPWTEQFRAEEDESGGPYPGHSHERTSGSLRNPLVRRAPYLYEDDPLREEFAQQLDPDRPITRRSSLYERYEDDEEY